MSQRFAEIAFTSTVQDIQERQGSRHIYANWEQREGTPALLGSKEKEFIEARDGFYQATVNAEGWPYVQFRGGPAGFLKVLDERTLGYADFRGNVQYISVGNMTDNDQVSMILMDYANRRRLKIFARAQLIESQDNPECVAKLENPHYRAHVERGVLLRVEAFDWNCPRHITQRFTQAEINGQFRQIILDGQERE